MLRATWEDNCRDHFLVQVNDLVSPPMARHDLSKSCEAHANVSLLCIFVLLKWSGTLLRQEVPFVTGTVHEQQGIYTVIFLANTCARQVEHPWNTLAELPNQTSSRRFFENFLDQLESLNTFSFLFYL